MVDERLMALLGDVGVDPEDASNIILIYLAEKENKLLQVKQVYY